MEKFLFLLLISSITIFAQDSGILIGLGYREIDSTNSNAGIDPVQKLVTLWLVKENDKYVCKNDFNELIVPRDTSFFRIGLKRSVYNLWTEDFVWCCPVDEYSPKIKGIDKLYGENVAGHNELTIYFVDKKYMSIGADGGTDAASKSSARITCWYDSYLINLDSFVNKEWSDLWDLDCKIPDDLANLFGSKFYDDFITQAQCFRDSVENDTSEYSNRGRIEDLPSGISLFRKNGHLVMDAQFGPKNSVEQGAYEYFRVNAKLLTELSGGEDDSVNWTDIQKKYPKAIDALKSPENNLLLILNKDKLLFFNIVDDRVEWTPIYEYKLEGDDHRILMYQWANQEEVVKWSKKFSEIEYKIDMDIYDFDVDQ